jgi:hypothetical protein
LVTERVNQQLLTKIPAAAGNMCSQGFLLNKRTKKGNKSDEKIEIRFYHGILGSLFITGIFGSAQY